MGYLAKINDIVKEKIKSLLSIRKKLVQSFQFKSSTTKRAVGANYTMEFTTETKKKIEELEAEVKGIVKQYFKTPEELINLLKDYKLDIYRIKNAEKLLNKIDEEEGFIIPQKGIKALMLNNLIGVAKKKMPKISLKTPAMFIFDVNNVEIYTVARALYKYYGYKNELPGYDYKSQRAYKTSKKRKKNTFKGFKPEEIFGCKEAMSRDMESINFTINLAVEYENSKKAAKKITDDGANI